MPVLDRKNKKIESLGIGPPIPSMGEATATAAGEGWIRPLLGQISCMPMPHAPPVLLLAGFVAVGGLLAGSAVMGGHLARSPAMGPHLTSCC